MAVKLNLLIILCKAKAAATAGTRQGPVLSPAINDDHIYGIIPPLAAIQSQSEVEIEVKLKVSVPQREA